MEFSVLSVVGSRFLCLDIRLFFGRLYYNRSAVSSELNFFFFPVLSGIQDPFKTNHSIKWLIVRKVIIKCNGNESVRTDYIRSNRILPVVHDTAFLPG